MQRRDANGQPFAPSWTWLSRVGPVSYTTIPLNKTVVIEKELEQMRSQAMDQAYELPATGFEDSFCTMLSDVPSHSRKLASPLPLIARLHHADHVNLPGMSISVSQWLKDLSEHRYVLDSGDSASLAGQAYILPLAYDKPTRKNELIATALIVEVFHYLYITVQS